jgi:hypothetical protein
MLSKPEAHRLPVQRHQSLLRCSMMRIGSVVLLLSLVATAACGGATTHDDASLQGGGAGTLGVEASGGNVGKTSSLAPLVPLISGHLSTYAFRPLDPALPMTETCDNPRTVVGEPTVIDGQSGVMYETFCGRNPFLVVGTGDQLTAVEIRDGRAAQSFEYIHSPVVPGESWQSGTGELFSWREAGSLITPSGSFESCWEREGAASQFFYCRGAGLVRAIDTEFNFLLDLVDKSF